jgi:hypothetical protein
LTLNPRIQILQIIDLIPKSLTVILEVMRLQISVTAVASIFTLASARIIGIAVPETIKPGDGFNAIIETENYIQAVYDVAIAFGAATGNGYIGTLGTVMDSFYLGPGNCHI